MPAILPPRPSARVYERPAEPVCARCGHLGPPALGDLHWTDGKGHGGCAGTVSSTERCPCNGFRPLELPPQGESGKLERVGP